MVDHEKIGPAERIIQTVLAYTDHAVHNRPGMVVADPSGVTGVRWIPVTYRLEGQTDPKDKVVYEVRKLGRRSVRTMVGTLGPDNRVSIGGRHVGDYRRSGLFPE